MLWRNSAVTVDGSYVVVNHKDTIVNVLYFAHLVSTTLRLFLDVSYTVKKVLKIEYLMVHGRVTYDPNTVAIKQVKCDQNRSFKA